MKTIREQLTRKLLLGFALLLCLGGAGTYYFTRQALLRQFDNALRAKANGVAAATELHGKRIDFEFSEQSLNEFENGVPVEFFQLRRADGTSLRRSKSLGEADLLAASGAPLHAGIADLNLPSGFHGRAVSYSFQPRASREMPPESLAQITIIFASDRRALDRTLSALALVLAGCSGLVLLATIIIVPRVLREELAPLNELSAQTERINADSLSARFPTGSMPGELQPITERLNSLLARLEESFDRERRFSADVAHELRTPIAELRSLAELALKWPENRPAETDRDALAIASQMHGIVARLLDLLRSQDGKIVAQRENFSLGALLEEIWRPLAARAAEKKLQVSKHFDADVQVSSDPVLLRSVVANLMDNAVEYTPHHGSINIDLESSEQLKLTITNTADGVLPADVPKFFERFWRKDAARTNGEHSGLGLCLACEFASALGCELSATLDAQSRVIFTLSGLSIVASPVNGKPIPITLKPAPKAIAGAG